MSKETTAPAQADQKAEEAPKWHEEPKTLEQVFENDRLREAAASTPEPEPVKEKAAEEKEADVPKPKPESESSDVPSTLEEALKKLGVSPDRIKSKVKVDGEEKEITLEEMQKNYQTWEHLSRLGNKIGEEKKELFKLRDERRQEISQRKPGEPASAAPDQDAAVDPYIQRLEERLARYDAVLQDLQPVLHERYRDHVAEELKAEGFSDFKEYLPKISTYVATVENPDQFAYYNTPEGAKALYFKFKAQDMQKAAATPTPPAPKPKNERPTPPIVRIPNGTGSGAGVSDDYAEKYAESMKRLQRTGDPEDVAALLRLKGYGS